MKGVCLSLLGSRRTWSVGCVAALRAWGMLAWVEGSMTGFAWARGSCDGLTLVKDSVFALMWEAVAAWMVPDACTASVGVSCKSRTWVASIVVWWPCTRWCVVRESPLGSGLALMENNEVAFASECACVMCPSLLGSGQEVSAK